jgi:hypothetical protein
MRNSVWFPAKLNEELPSEPNVGLIRRGPRRGEFFLNGLKDLGSVPRVAFRVRRNSAEVIPMKKRRLPTTV